MPSKHCGNLPGSHPDSAPEPVQGTITVPGLLDQPEIRTSDELVTNGPLTFQTWIPATIGRLAMRVFVMRGPVCARRRFRRAPGGGRSFFARQLEPRWAARSSERARCRDPQAPNAPRHGVGPGGHVPSNRLAPGPLWLTPRTKPCKGWSLNFFDVDRHQPAARFDGPARYLCSVHEGQVRARRRHQATRRRALIFRQTVGTAVVARSSGRARCRDPKPQMPCGTEQDRGVIPSNNLALRSATCQRPACRRACKSPGSARSALPGGSWRRRRPVGSASRAR